MRICLISREFAPFFGAGIGTYAASWARALAAAGHEVHVLSREHRTRAGTLTERGPDLFPGVRFHAVDPRLGPPRLDHNYPYARHSLAVLATLRRLHQRHPFDVIEYPEYWAEGHAISQARRTIGDLAPAVLVCRLHMSSALCRDLDADRTYPHYAAYLDIMEHESVAHADVVLSPSAELIDLTRSRILRHRYGQDLPRAAVLRYPFDPDGLDDAAIPGPSEPGGPPLVLCVGRIERRKGQDVLAAAAALLAQRGVHARFAFVGPDTGSGPFGRSMRRSIEDRLPDGLRSAVSFLGPLPRSQLGPLIRRAAVCVFPARWDNFPNTLLEAMSLGKAVVTTDAGGPGEIVQHGSSGLVCPPESPAALAEQIAAALADDALRTRLGEAARARVAELCDPPGIVAQFESIIEAARTDGAGARRSARPVRAVDTDPEVSVVVPHYNLPEFLPETLESIRRQTFRSLEVIVVDDGSTRPDALELIGSLESTGVRVVRRENGGLSAARNTGLHAARGRFVLPVDADDLLSPTFVEKAVAAMHAEPDLAYATALVSYFRETPARRFGGWVPVGLHRDLLPIHNCAGCCMALFRREALESIGGYCTDLTAYEDWDVYCALASSDARGVIIPEFLLHYRIRDNSLLRTEAEVRKQHLHAALLARHAGLPLDHTRVMRTMLSEKMEAGNLSRAGLRYRVADRLNLALKRSPLHGAIKGLAERTIEVKRSRRRQDA
ncbi:MAG: glycosyltransferase [Phycisphaerales bacterium]